MRRTILFAALQKSPDGEALAQFGLTVSGFFESAWNKPPRAKHSEMKEFQGLLVFLEMTCPPRKECSIPYLAMNEPGRRNPSPAVGDPGGVGKAEQRWERLLRNGQCVGYRRDLGRAQMFSSDGYGWGAQPIDHDTRLPEASFGGGSLKVFHGDILEMPYRYDDQSHCTLIVFVTEAGEEFLFDPETTRFDSVTALWPPPNKPFARRCVGSIWDSAELRDKSLGVLSALLEEKKPGFEMVAQAAAVVSLGILSSGLLQWTLLREVGPLTSLFGGFLAISLLLSSWRRTQPQLFSRRWALSMTWRVALMCGLVCVSMLLLFSYSAIQLIGLGVLAIVSSGLLWLWSVDLVTWRTGGYERESKSKRRPGARWD